MFKDFLNSYARTLIMGILNITPDSFYDGGKYLDQKNLKNKFDFLNKSDIIDIGAESSRPGAVKVDEVTEIKRISSIIPFLNKKNKYYSIDTYKPNVASFAIKNGFNMVNDITGGSNPLMLDIVSDANIPIVLMHMQGNPKNMQNNPRYNNIIDDLLSFFETRIESCLKHGISKNQIIIDPGIGFGKDSEQNISLINNISIFHALGCLIMLGVSRKRFISSLANSEKPKDRLSGSISAALYGFSHGVQIFRVHDVKETKQALGMWSKLGV